MGMSRFALGGPRSPRGLPIQPLQRKQSRSPVPGPACRNGPTCFEPCNKLPRGLAPRDRLVAPRAILATVLRVVADRGKPRRNAASIDASLRRLATPCSSTGSRRVHSNQAGVSLCSRGANDPGSLSSLQMRLEMPNSRITHAILLSHSSVYLTRQRVRTRTSLTSTANSSPDLPSFASFIPLPTTMHGKRSTTRPLAITLTASHSGLIASHLPLHATHISVP